MKLQATVDLLRRGMYEVAVSGIGRERKYLISERDESRAAFEGMRQFESEMVNIEGWRDLN